jgi:hypothetical protein
MSTTISDPVCLLIALRVIGSPLPLAVDEDPPLKGADNGTAEDDAHRKNEGERMAGGIGGPFGKARKQRGVVHEVLRGVVFADPIER